MYSSIHDQKSNNFILFPQVYESACPSRDVRACLRACLHAHVRACVRINIKGLVSEGQGEGQLGVESGTLK